jgi:PIN domain nuclease of toxin-antitoxin system
MIFAWNEKKSDNIDLYLSSTLQEKRNSLVLSMLSAFVCLEILTGSTANPLTAKGYLALEESHIRFIVTFP